MKVLFSDADPEAVPLDPRLQKTSFEDLLAVSDYVVCLAISNEATFHLFNARAFNLMKPGSFFLNPSRGQLVDEPSLLVALSSGHLAGAALDVGMAPDQMPSLELAGHPKVLATPHVGGLTPQAAEHQAFDTVRQVEALLKGKMPEGALNGDRASRLEKIGVRIG
jgi:D-3-phosphoglycerate dehydrogenase